MGHMKKGIVVSFTGSGGVEVPLLYYAAKHYEDIGYDKKLIKCYMAEVTEFDKTYEAVKQEVKNLNLIEYDKIVFVSKSIGTAISCRIKEELNISAELILFTPIEETLPYIRKNNDIVLVAAGNRDRHLDSEKLINRCISENVKYHIEDGVGHRMEVMNELEKNLAVVKNIVSQI